MSASVGPTRDRFLGGRVTILQPRRGYRAATDPVLLAAFVPARPGQAVLELGCGVGTALICLAYRVPGLALTGVELQDDLAALARRNLALNGMTGQIATADLMRLPPSIARAGFDQVLANPPFDAMGRGTPSPLPGRRPARIETGAGLADWIAVGLRRLKPRGTLTLIHRAGRLPEILAALAGRAGGVEILPLQPRPGRPCGRVLIRARKGSGAAAVLHPPFTLHQGMTHRLDADDYAPRAAAILREGEPLLP